MIARGRGTRTYKVGLRVEGNFIADGFWRLLFLLTLSFKVNFWKLYIPSCKILCLLLKKCWGLITSLVTMFLFYFFFNILNHRSIPVVRIFWGIAISKILKIRAIENFFYCFFKKNRRSHFSLGFLKDLLRNLRLRNLLESMFTWGNHKFQFWILFLNYKWLLWSLYFTVRNLVKSFLLISLPENWVFHYLPLNGFLVHLWNSTLHLSSLWKLEIHHSTSQNWVRRVANCKRSKVLFAIVLLNSAIGKGPYMSWLVLVRILYT